MRDLAGARLFGQKTMGAVLPAAFDQLPNGDYLQYVIASYVTCNGEVLEGAGVAPDERTNAGRSRNREEDRTIQAAIEWMKGKTESAKSGKPFFLYLPYTSPHYPVCPLPEFWGKGDAGGYGEFMIETDYHVILFMTDRRQIEKLEQLFQVAVTFI